MCVRPGVTVRSESVVERAFVGRWRRMSGTKVAIDRLAVAPMLRRLPDADGRRQLDPVGAVTEGMQGRVWLRPGCMFPRVKTKIAVGVVVAVLLSCCGFALWRRLAPNHHASGDKGCYASTAE